MWVMSEHGFFSAVDAGNGNVKVRARVKRHLQNLERNGLYKGLLGRAPRIHTTQDTDYRHRVIVPRAAWAEVVKRLAEATHYGNFKDHVKATGDDDYERQLHHVWEAMYWLQEWELRQTAMPACKPVSEEHFQRTQKRRRKL
jgi:hypothetical protein